MKTLFSGSLCSLLLGVVSALGESRGVINDADGFTNVRAGQSLNSAIVGVAKTGEVFEFEGGEGSEWWRVTLASGKSGWMNQSRIRFYVEQSDLPEGDETDELTEYGRSRGINYFALAKGAAKGEARAMQRYFAITDTDGAAAEIHTDVIKTVVHLLGDEKLATHLSKQPLEYQLGVRRGLADDFVLGPFYAFEYLKRNFPQTAALFFRSELTSWPSPDRKYVIRKVFSDALPREDSSVSKAEVIEAKTGRVVADLSEDDTGTGMDREGKVLWSPDSKRFAYYSKEHQMGQTVVYALEGAEFTPVDLPEVVLPGRAADPELKGATRIHEDVEPLKWEKQGVLEVRSHEYFERQRADTSIQSIGRTYVITYDLKEGTAKAVEERH